MKCEATTLKGKPCKKNAVENGLCGTHLNGKKSTNAEIEIRQATVAEMIVKGQSYDEICRYAAKQWNVSTRTTDRYIDAAWSKIKASVDKDVEKQVHLALNRYEDLYKRNFNIQDYRECRQVQGDIVKLLGIAEAKKIDINITPDWNPENGDPKEFVQKMISK